VSSISGKAMVLYSLYIILDVKRKIPLTKIAGVTVSKLSTEFVLHVPDEYDYRYSSSDKYCSLYICSILGEILFWIP
jgi:serum/glucocorticoid-regulated kinase 2